MNTAANEGKHTLGSRFCGSINLPFVEFSDVTCLPCMIATGTSHRPHWTTGSREGFVQTLFHDNEGARCHCSSQKPQRGIVGKRRPFGVVRSLTSNERFLTTPTGQIFTGLWGTHRVGHGLAGGTQLSVAGEVLGRWPGGRGWQLSMMEGTSSFFV